MTKENEALTGEAAMEKLKAEIASAKPDAKGAVDWGLLLRLYQAVQTFGPTAVALLQQIISYFQSPSPPQAMTSAPKGAEGCCDHKECCLQVLKSALGTAHCAAVHYQSCCEEEGEG
jgi:hypothetical protein